MGHYSCCTISVELRRWSSYGSVGSVSTLIESILSTEWQCLKNKSVMNKAITILECVMFLTLTCRNLSTDI